MFAGGALFLFFLGFVYCTKYLAVRSLMAKYGYLRYCVRNMTCQGRPASGWLSFPRESLPPRHRVMFHDA